MAFSAFAGNEYAWIGDAGDGKFSNPQNWSPEGVPTNGAVAKFPEKVLTLAAETVDIGEGGLTIRHPWDLTCNVVFTGRGKLVKEGTGKLTVKSASTYEGGTKIVDGTVRLGNYTFSLPGPFEIVCADGKKPLLSGHTQWWEQPVTVTGANARQTVILLENNSSIAGGLIADGDVTIDNGYAYSGGCSINGISAHGHTIYLTNNKEWHYPYTISGAIDATLDFMACNAAIAFKGKLTDPESSYVIRGGTHTIDWNAELGCAEVVVDDSEGQNAVLAVSGQAFHPATVLKLVSGGKVCVAQGCRVRVASCTTNGIALPAGDYTKANLPSVMTGDGELAVGAFSSWLGGGSRTWEDPACWFDGVVPQSGGTAVFGGNATVYAGSGVDIGSAGITIDNSLRVTLNTVFSGQGTLTKKGSGSLVLKGASTYAGGTVLSDGVLMLNNSLALGTGTVQICRSAGKSVTLNPCLNCNLTNAVVVTGGYTPGETTFRFENNGSIFGPISASDDIAFFQDYTFGNSGTAIFGGLSMHGHTAHFTSVDYWVTMSLAGEIDASLSFESPNLLVHNLASMVDSEATYSVTGGSNLVYVAGGTELKRVTVDNAKLRLVTGAAFPNDLTLTLANGAKVDLVGSVRQKAAKFVCGSETKPFGVYTAANLPDWLEGAGSLRVRDGNGLLVVVDGAISASQSSESPKTLFLAGDSTLDNHGGVESTFGSWGWNLRWYLKDGNVIDDRAVSGYSTPSFRDDGMWTNLLASVKSGDFVIVQFGHNDMDTASDKSWRMRFQATPAQYQDNFRLMVDEVRAKGGVPVIVTTTARNTWNGGILVDEANGRGETLRDYALAAIEVATEKSCDCVDLNALVSAELTLLGQAASAGYFADKDTTHLNVSGARRVAGLFRDEVRRRHLPIAALFK